MSRTEQRPPIERVRIKAGIGPTGTGTIVSETKWTVTVRLDADGVAYEYGRSAVTPIKEGVDDDQRHE